MDIERVFHHYEARGNENSCGASKITSNSHICSQEKSFSLTILYVYILLTTVEKPGTLDSD